ncbi:MAG: glucosaminidase domain-containing protein [Bacillota bacterium]
MYTDEFIKKIASAARECHKRTGVFASCIIAQAALESGWGKTVPVDKKTGRSSYNLFGIKGEGPCGYVEIPHPEFENGKKVWRMAKFRCYRSFAECIEDYEKIIMHPRYKPVREACDPDEAAYQLYKCGYATDPAYPEKLISIMRKYNLYIYDND